MSKTIFTPGSLLDSTWCGTVYGTSATTGHAHDGVDSDGHAPQIPLAGGSIGVSGQLRYANYQLPTGYISGLQITPYNVSDSWGIGLSNGICMSNSLVSMSINTYSGSNKKVIASGGLLYSNFVSGYGNGGVDPDVAGIFNNQVLYVFLLTGTATGNVLADIAFDDDVNATNLRSHGYGTYYRRIGCIQIIQVAGGKYQIRQYTQKSDYFYWKDNGSYLSSTLYDIAQEPLVGGDATLCSVGCPPACTALMRSVSVAVSTDTPGSVAYASVLLHPCDASSNMTASDIPMPTSIGYAIAHTYDGTTGSSIIRSAGETHVQTDASTSQIKLSAYVQNTGDGYVNFYASCYGYIDTRGKDS